ncbi:maltodextrin glucosidase [compost metagenome]
MESQLQSSVSLLSRYRQLIALRSGVPALQNGGIADFTSGNETVMTFERLTADEQVLVAINLSGEAQTLTLHAGTNGYTYSGILQAVPGEAKLTGETLSLPPYTTVILD